MEQSLVIIVPLVLLVILFLIGMPIGFVLLFTGAVGMTMKIGFGPTLQYLGQHGFTSVASFVFIAIPMFVLMGDVLVVSGIGAELFGAALKWFGKLRGGLAISAIASCAVFAAMTGLSMAGAATVGLVAIPEMRKQGYDKGLATGTVAVAGTLGILIPPSLPFILYGIIAGQSIGKLFIAGILPGVMLAVIFALYVLFIAWRRPVLAPAYAGKVTWKDRLLSIKKLWAAVVLIIAVLGSIYGGIATPTEAAGVGALGAIIIAAIYRSINLKKFKEMLRLTAHMISFLTIIIAGALLFGYYLTLTGTIHAFSGWVTSLSMPGWLFMAMISFVLLLLGSFLSATPIILITTPLFAPIIASYGFDLIWYGVVLVILLEVAQVTPPEAVNLYVVSAIVPDIPLSTIIRGTLPFLGLCLLALLILYIFPQIAIWLPSTMIR